MAKSVFVTVGTTSFDKLISTLCKTDTIKILVSRGYTRMTMQIGNASFQPNIDIPSDQFTLDFYSYKSSIFDDISHADLIISHAGSGSCLEVLGAGKPLVVVVNDSLMSNHQLELARKLNSDGHLLYSDCRHLAELLANMDLTSLKPFAPANTSSFASFLDAVMGVS